MTKHLLIIEDDNFFLKFYSTKLRDSGFLVDTAVNGKEGLEKMRTDRYDLILLDLVMPEIDGFTVLKTKAEDEKIKNIPVIVFSTLGMEKDVDEAKLLGAKDYLNKTFYNIDELLHKIQSNIH